MTVTPSVIYKRTTVDARATLAGVLEMLQQLPAEVPQHAEIATVAEHYACPDWAHDEDFIHGLDEDEDTPGHEPEAYLAITFQWGDK